MVSIYSSLKKGRSFRPQVGFEFRLPETVPGQEADTDDNHVNRRRRGKAFTINPKLLAPNPTP